MLGINGMSTELFIITHKETGDIWVSDTGKWSWTGIGQQTAAWNRTHKGATLYSEFCPWQELGNPNCRYERSTIGTARNIEVAEDWPEYYKEIQS